MESSKKVTAFNGKGDVNVFLMKVDLYNQLKGYDGETAAVSLASRLEEPAINVYMRMSVDDRKDIKKVQKELRKQYEVGNADREQALSLLGAVQRKEDETAKDFGYRITALVKLAYPTFDDASKQVHEKDAFVKGCHPDMQMKLKTLENFATLDMNAVVDNTVRLEVAGVKAVTKNFKAEMNTVNDQGACCNSSRGRDEVLLERLDNLEETIAKLSVSQGATGGSPNSSTTTGKGKAKKCFKCKETSHIVKNCPKRFCQACGQTGHDWWMQSCPSHS